MKKHHPELNLTPCEDCKKDGDIITFCRKCAKKTEKVISKVMMEDLNLTKYASLGLMLEKTGGMCPEQYDVYDINMKQVGYLRLRHGSFRVDYPNCGGDTIYEASPRGDGVFEDNERGFYIAEALQAIVKRMADDLKK